MIGRGTRSSRKQPTRRGPLSLLQAKAQDLSLRYTRFCTYDLCTLFFAADVFAGSCNSLAVDTNVDNKSQSQPPASERALTLVNSNLKSLQSVGKSKERNLTLFLFGNEFLRFVSTRHNHNNNNKVLSISPKRYLTTQTHFSALKLSTMNPISLQAPPNARQIQLSASFRKKNGQTYDSTRMTLDST